MNWIWILIRVTGLTGYLLLTLSLLAGINRHIPRKKAFIHNFHQTIGQIALLFIGVHACLLVFDNYEPYSISEILLPFASTKSPILAGIGTIAAYLLIIVIVTSDFMKEIGRNVWKKAHYLVYPLWFLSTIHGLFLGTDSQTLWAGIMYISTTAAVVFTTLYLVYKKSGKKQTNIKQGNPKRRSTKPINE